MAEHHLHRLDIGTSRDREARAVCWSSWGVSWVSSGYISSSLAIAEAATGPIAIAERTSERRSEDEIVRTLALAILGEHVGNMARERDDAAAVVPRAVDRETHSSVCLPYASLVRSTRDLLPSCRACSALSRSASERRPPSGGVTIGLTTYAVVHAWPEGAVPYSLYPPQWSPRA